MIPHEVMSDEGTCMRCGRKITDKLSMERGLGPSCYKKYMAEQAEIGFEKDQMTIDEIA